MIRGWGTLRLFVGLRGIPGHPPRPRHTSTPFSYRHERLLAVPCEPAPLSGHCSRWLSPTLWEFRVAVAVALSSSPPVGRVTGTTAVSG